MKLVTNVENLNQAINSFLKCKHSKSDIGIEQVQNLHYYHNSVKQIKENVITCKYAIYR